MKVGVITNAFREEDMIVGCIEQFKRSEHLWHHQVLVSKKPWNGNYKPDDTSAVAVKLGASVEVGIWESAQEQLNHGLELFRDYDWVIICDADERYTQGGLDDLWHVLKNVLPGFPRALRTNNWSVYWKTPEWEIIPKQTDYPLIAIRPSERFGHIRSYDGPQIYCDVHMYHLSYVRTNAEMLKKVQTFDASTEFNTMFWYENVWMTNSKKDLHPVHPSQFAGVEYNPVPEELWDLIPRKYWGLHNDKERT